MSRNAFIIAGGRIVHIANPSGAGTQYLAATQLLLPGIAVPPHRSECCETVLVVTSGCIEMMVEGASSWIAAGNFARIPPRHTFAYRNQGDEVAELLVRTTPVRPPKIGMQITVAIAAA